MRRRLLALEAAQRANGAGDGRIFADTGPPHLYTLQNQNGTCACQAPSISLSRKSSCFKAPLNPDPACTTQSVNGEQSVGSIYNEAVQFHKAGMVVEAESKFRQALSRNKRHVRCACISVPVPAFVFLLAPILCLRLRPSSLSETDHVSRVRPLTCDTPMC